MTKRDGYARLALIAGALCIGMLVESVIVGSPGHAIVAQDLGALALVYLSFAIEMMKWGNHD